MKYNEDSIRVIYDKRMTESLSLSEAVSSLGVFIKRYLYLLLLLYSF